MYQVGLSLKIKYFETHKNFFVENFSPFKHCLDAHWHTLKMDQEMNQKQKHKFKEYDDNITSGAFLDDYFGLWALKMDVLEEENGSRVWAKYGNGTSKVDLHKYYNQNIG